MIGSQKDANHDHRKSKIFLKIDVKTVVLNSKNSEDHRINSLELLDYHQYEEGLLSSIMMC